MVALPRAAAAIPRWRDRRRILAAGWEAWTPIALGAMGVATAGSLLELAQAFGPIERRRARLRTASALLGLASTTAATILGRKVKRERAARDAYGMQRDASGYPLAMSRTTRLEQGMIPLNVLHAFGAAGLVLADA